VSNWKPTVAIVRHASDDLHFRKQVHQPVPGWKSHEVSISIRSRITWRGEPLIRLPHVWQFAEYQASDQRFQDFWFKHHMMGHKEFLE